MIAYKLRYQIHSSAPIYSYIHTTPRSLSDPLYGLITELCLIRKLRVILNRLDLGVSELPSRDFVHEQSVELRRTPMFGLGQTEVCPKGTEEAASCPEESGFAAP